MKRKVAGIDEGETQEASVGAASESGEVTALRAENAALKEQMNRIEMMMAGKQAAAPKRGRKPKVVEAGE